MEGVCAFKNTLVSHFFGQDVIMKQIIPLSNVTIYD